MINITGEDINEVFVKLSKKLIEEGEESSPRGLKTLELRDVFVTIKKPTLQNVVITHPARNLSLKYLNAEMDWYLSGSLNIDEISKASKFWNKLANKQGNVQSNYGYLVLYDLINGQSQYDWCRKRLIEDPDTRQAVLNYNQPHHKVEGTRDYVCTLAQTFRTRQDRFMTPEGESSIKVLDSTVFMRSNDLIYGFSYDVPWFTYLQRKLADDININEGEYNHFACSMHVYEPHFDIIKKACQDAPNEQNHIQLFGFDENNLLGRRE